MDRSLVLVDSGPTVDSVTAPDLVVLLTPRAWAAQRRLGTTEGYVLDDLVDRRATVGGVIAHVRFVKGWLAQLDEVTGGSGAALAALPIIGPALDSAVTKGRMLATLLDIHEPTTVEYQGRSGSTQTPLVLDGHLQFQPERGHQPLALGLLARLCADRGIPLHVRSPPMTAVPGPAPPSALRARVRTRASSLLRLAQVLGPPMSRSNASLMAWTAGFGAEGIAARERSRGQVVVAARERRGALDIVRMGPRGITRIAPPVAIAMSEPPGQGANRAPELDAVVAELAGYAGTSAVAEAMRSRIVAYANTVVPTVARAATALEAVLKRAQVDRIVCATASTVSEQALLVAGGRVGSERVLSQHGDHAFGYEFWLTYYTSHIDEMWLSDPTVAVDLEAGAVAIGSPAPRFEVDPVRLRRARNVPPPRTDGPICYVPSLFTGDSLVTGGGYFDDAWYFRWQMTLLAWMGAQEGLQFVWKALPKANQAEDPIPAILASDGPRNVRYAVGRLLDEYQRCSRVLIDFPSTPLYEAVHARRPVLAVVFTKFASVRPAAQQMFGRSLALCETEADALARLNDFTATPASEWLVPPERLGQRSEDGGT